MPLSFGFVLFLCALYAVVRLHESHAMRDWFDELRRLWRSMGVPGRAIAIVCVCLATLHGGGKWTSPLMRLLFWHPASVWQLHVPAETAASAASSAVTASNDVDYVHSQLATTDVVTVSFDWHAPDRLPFHDAQNVMGWCVTVVPTNIDGVLCEDHFVCFNSAASTNPAVILIEYARRTDAGDVERISATVFTNSYPNSVPVTVQSGVHTCYWFRCKVPSVFTNSLRDWNGEALFGSPRGSGKGFDVIGTLVVDSGADVWIGATTNMVIGNVTNAVMNGIVTEAQ